MKKITLTILLLFTFQLFYATSYLKCKLIMTDNTVKYGRALTPDMADKTIRFKDKDKNVSDDIKSDKIQAIEFYDNYDVIKYERILTYKNYRNKKPYKKKSWLEVKEFGYVTLYFGFQPGYNFPNMNIWYCKKADENIASVISIKYTGGLTITIGAESTFRTNATTYFSDCPELVEKINSKELNFKDLSTIVKYYNNWKENNK